LQSKEILTGAVSNSQNALHQELKDFGLLGSFDVVIGSNDGHREKPDPQMFGLALDALGVTPSKCWYVGDGLINDMLGASRAGIHDMVLVDRYGVYARPLFPSVRSMADLLEIVAFL
jgi:putative hydrolase of the HAD superfamily